MGIVIILVVFMGSCLFEERDIFDSFFFEVFFLYISKDEVDILKQCKEGKFEVNDNDVLEVLSIVVINVIKI